jgi:DNA-directed RNA polymerase subunit M/transcription elongation factor TFIIS
MGIEKADMRARVASRFARALENRSEELGAGGGLDFALLGNQLEICTWNSVIRNAGHDLPLAWEAPQFRFRYTTKALSLEQNLKNGDNPELCRRVLNRELGLKKLANMHPMEMFPERWEEAFEKSAKMQLARAGYADNHADGAVQCSKCKSMKTSYISMQTRSADEPMTLFFSCHECGKRWKS